VVDESSIAIRGSIAPTAKNYAMAELLPGMSPLAFEANRQLHAVSTTESGAFRLEVPRYDELDQRDRLYSRWLLVDRLTAVPLSRGHFADEVHSQRTLVPATPQNRKGLGAFALSRPLDDVRDLEISAVTVNITLDNWLRTEPAAGWFEYPFQGRLWYIRQATAEHYDQLLREAAKFNLMVSAILLLPQADRFTDVQAGRLLTIPTANARGLYVMPNTSSPIGGAAYLALLNFLAERYSHEDGRYGRIHHWIMHNEVNSGSIWTNAGELPVWSYAKLYLDSMRWMHLAARKYDPHAIVFASLDHHWTSRHDETCYPGQELLDCMIQLSQAEGDFPWGIAFHPYPQNLFDPRVWQDTQATYRWDTAKITFKNLEVLDAWCEQTKHQFRGKTPRTLHLTEQGLNSQEYTPAALQQQAAGLAYAWKKLEPLRHISMFHYHNWVDNRHEGGLKIGLRRFADDPVAPLAPKPIWHLFRDLDSPRQTAAVEFALPLIGIQSWEEILHLGPIVE
jgi:hypothetical protein